MRGFSGLLIFIRCLKCKVVFERFCDIIVWFDWFCGKRKMLVGCFGWCFFCVF